MLVEAIFLAIGLYLIIFVGILGYGMKGPVSRHIAKLLGTTWMRIVSIVLGIGFIGVAVASYFELLNLA